jgi:hypothetical protein
MSTDHKPCIVITPRHGGEPFTLCRRPVTDTAIPSHVAMLLTADARAAWCCARCAKVYRSPTGRALTIPWSAKPPEPVERRRGNTPGRRRFQRRRAQAEARRKALDALGLDEAMHRSVIA